MSEQSHVDVPADHVEDIDVPEVPEPEMPDPGGIDPADTYREGHA